MESGIELACSSSFSWNELEQANSYTINCYTHFALQHWKEDDRLHPFKKFKLGVVQSSFLVRP